MGYHCSCCCDYCYNIEMLIKDVENYILEFKKMDSDDSDDIFYLLSNLEDFIRAMETRLHPKENSDSDSD